MTTRTCENMSCSRLMTGTSVWERVSPRAPSAGGMVIELRNFAPFYEFPPSSTHVRFPLMEVHLAMMQQIHLQALSFTRTTIGV